MERAVGLAVAVSMALALAGLLVLATIAVPGPSRTLSIQDLRAGADFDLAGVEIQETYFLDRSMVDLGTTVAFLVHFADGTSENVSFVFQTFMCRDVTVATVHREPQVVFSARCGQSSVLVAVL